ncbi:MAG: hypothetical protein JWO67_4077 [Streptosporangiaceae bacterium]|nr:hypothetical protein [Streptosporangiaceae bacterium]
MTPVAQAVRMGTGLLPEPRVEAEAFCFVDDEFSVQLRLTLSAGIVGWMTGDPHEPWDQFSGDLDDFDPVTTSMLTRAVLHAIPHDVLVAAWRAGEAEVRKRMDRADAA